MTVAIKSSLSNLDQSLQKLETSLTERASSPKPVAKSSPNDLFSRPNASASNDVDAKALASRLDGAIAKVEKLLREG